ncbi:hypothetical protein OG785_42670 [Streptomyces sp. NBC_00006]|uniref:hypothetical protein n=1 Tax=Streptomyces sp. NBC_00006 TaxID=2975619 RepID=UPI0022592E5C|nr:hypothetical protein [Streptomyces sp. NBC_00006]MCX5537260.1 hypothetical protein [Streptomyces sp. NBC_00006]
MPVGVASALQVAQTLAELLQAVDVARSTTGPAPLGLALIAPAITTFGTQPVLLTCALICFLAPAAAALAPTARHFTRAPGAQVNPRRQV